MKIPVAAPDLSGNELAYVSEAIESSWISSSGAFVDRFESEFAAMCGTRAGVSVVNGTAALHLALLALGVGPGDEVVVPSLTYVATANAAHYVGATPVFVDVDATTWCMDPDLLAEAVTPRTRAVIPVHLYGHPADMDAIDEVASAHGIAVVEDAAESHLARYRGRPTGSLGTLATWSFYGNKILTSGEGGAITLDDPELEARIRLLRGQGMDPQRRYYFPVTGYNFRMTNVACAIACAQLERGDNIVRRRRAVFELYREELDGIPGIGFHEAASWAEPAPWLFCITVDEGAFGLTRDELADALAAEGVETRPFFVPLHTLPPFRDEAARRGAHLPLTERLGRTGLNLPTSTQFAAEDVRFVAAAVRRAHARG